MRKNIFPTLMVTVALLGCRTDHPEHRIQRYLGVSASTNPQQLRIELLQTVPVGTTEQHLYDRLKSARISEDPFASWHPADKNNVVLFRTGRDNRFMDVVTREYAVFFYLDAARKVRDIQVREWLTGP